MAPEHLIHYLLPYVLNTGSFVKYICEIVIKMIYCSTSLFLRQQCTIWRCFPPNPSALQELTMEKLLTERGSQFDPILIPLQKRFSGIFYAWVQIRLSSLQHQILRYFVMAGYTFWNVLPWTVYFGIEKCENTPPPQIGTFSWKILTLNLKRLKLLMENFFDLF